MMTQAIERATGFLRRMADYGLRKDFNPYQATKNPYPELLFANIPDSSTVVVMMFAGSRKGITEMVTIAWGVSQVIMGGPAIGGAIRRALSVSESDLA